MMNNKRDDIRLWRDNGLSGGMEILRASCFEHSYPAHFHNEFVIAAFARGAQRHRVCRHAGVAAAGTVMIIHPGEVHTGEALQRDKGWDYCAIYPSEALVEEVAASLLGGRGSINFGRDVMRHDPMVARGLLQASLLLTQSEDPLEKECALFQVLGAIIGQYGQRTVRGVATGSRRADMRRATDFLHSAYHRPVTVGKVASVVGLSEFHFMRTFQANTGLSVHRYLTQIRLARAKALLAQGVSAAQTALDVGFFDQSHFIRHFRTHFGITPGAFGAACR